MRFRLAALALLALPLVSEHETTQLLKYDGSGNIEYVCRARPNQAEYSWTVAAETLASIVDSSNTSTATTSTAHGLAIGNKVTVTGATDTDLNTTYVIATVPSTTTFTITTANVTDATYSDAPLALSTRAPRSNATIWAIERFQYTSGSMSSVQLPVSSQNLAVPNAIFSCDARATYEYR